MESIGDGDGAVEKKLPEEQGVGVKAGYVEVGVDLLRGFEAAALAQQ